MTPILYLIIGTTITAQPTATMDACITALKALEPAAAYRSYCIDPRSGETVTGRKRVEKKPTATPVSAGPEWEV